MPSSDNCKILIHCALPIEAKELAKHLGAKLDTQSGPFACYMTDTILLVCSGIGKVLSAAAVSRMLSMAHTQHTFVLNFGLAAAPKEFSLGDLVIAHKVTDWESSKNYYPDITLRHTFSEGSLISVNTPVDSTLDDISLVDMEASAVFQTANLFVPTSRIGVLKIVSDHFSSKLFKKEDVIDLISQNSSAFSTYLDNVFEFLKTQSQNQLVVSQEYLEKITTAANFSTTQKLELKREIKAHLVRSGGVYPNLDQVIFDVSTKREQNHLHQLLIARLQGAH